MAGEELKSVTYNPFAYQAQPVDTPAVKGKAVEPKQQEQQGGELLLNLVKPRQAFAYVDGSQIDRNFIKNAFAYAGTGYSPESRTNYDDSDYRGRGAYYCA